MINNFSFKMKPYLVKEGKLSEEDLALLESLKGKCRANYKRVSEELGVSHTAVRKRVAKLVSRGYVAIEPLLNLKKLGFILALLFLEVASEKHLSKLLETFSECPRIISLFKTIGEYNLVALIYAEDAKVLDSILGTCMLRTMEGIRRSEVVLISDVLLNEYYRLKIPVRRLEKAPCGADCFNCERFRKDKCLGCPAVKCYTGWFSLR